MFNSDKKMPVDGVESPTEKKDRKSKNPNKALSKTEKEIQRQNAMI